MGAVRLFSFRRRAHKTLLKNASLRSEKGLLKGQWEVISVSLFERLLAVESFEDFVRRLLNMIITHSRKGSFNVLMYSLPSTHIYVFVTFFQCLRRTECLDEFEIFSDLHPELSISQLNLQNTKSRAKAAKKSNDVISMSFK